MLVYVLVIRNIKSVVIRLKRWNKNVSKNALLIICGKCIVVVVLMYVAQLDALA